MKIGISDIERIDLGCLIKGCMELQQGVNICTRFCLSAVTFRDGTLRLVVWVVNNRRRETIFKKTTQSQRRAAGRPHLESQGRQVAW